MKFLPSKDEKDNLSPKLSPKTFWSPIISILLFYATIIIFGFRVIFPSYCYLLQPMFSGYLNYGVILGLVTLISSISLGFLSIKWLKREKLAYNSLQLKAFRLQLRMTLLFILIPFFSLLPPINLVFVFLTREVMRFLDWLLIIIISTIILSLVLQVIGFFQAKKRKTSTATLILICVLLISLVFVGPILIDTLLNNYWDQLMLYLQGEYCESNLPMP